MRREYEPLWEKCAAFHGHECGGLAVGFQAVLYAMELLGLKGRAEDEEIVCISENDACGVDAIQVVLGCTVGKGNLLFHLTGKQAYTFYERASGRGVRIAARPKPEGLKKGGTLEYMRPLAPSELFYAMAPALGLPERARLFGSAECSVCGEIAAEAFMYIEGGKPVCRDCRKAYSRLSV